MIEVIRSTVQKARKEYYDDGWDTIQDWIGDGCPVYIGQRMERGHLLFSEARFLVKVRQRLITGHKILNGQIYRSQFNKYDGTTYYWRTKEEFYKLMCKYDLFPEI